MQVLDQGQARQLLTTASGDRFEALYVVALTTGMRLGELLALKWRDIDLEKAKLQVRASVRYLKGGGYAFTEPKTKYGRRSIALTSAAKTALRTHRKRQNEERLRVGPGWQDAELVFPNSIGTVMDGKRLTQREFHPLLQLAGLSHIRFHDLRHTCATTLLGSGINPKAVSEMLGHSSINITLNLYGHVLPHMQQQAADVMDAILGR